MSPRQIENAVDAVNPDEIKHVVQKYLWVKDVRLLSISCLSPSMCVFVGADLSSDCRSLLLHSARWRDCSTTTVFVLID